MHAAGLMGEMKERYVKATFTLFNEKIDGILTKIRQLAENAENEAQLAAYTGKYEALGRELFQTWHYWNRRSNFISATTAI